MKATVRYFIVCGCSSWSEQLPNTDNHAGIKS